MSDKELIEALRKALQKIYDCGSIREAEQIAESALNLEAADEGV